MKKLIVLSILFIAACADSSDKAADNQNREVETETTQSDPEMPVDSGDQTGDYNYLVEASGNTMSEIRYDIKELKVPAKTEITITLKNNSSDATMLHNFVIIEEGTANDVGQSGLKYPDDDYVRPNDLNVIAHSPLAKPGETVEFTFKTPESGTYDFVCTFPGHWGLMKGKFIVE
ncbi:hypothetical protein GYB22_06075 [bacterium]|nr:hypothetical protein [bacterium]